MRVLLVAYSNIAARRVVPALDALGFEGIDIATNRPNVVNTAGLKTPIRIFTGYEEGIRRSDAQLCYISTVNSAHFPHALLSLERGKHTIVDKPITMESSQAEQLVELSREKELLLSESIVYLDHVRNREIFTRFKELSYHPRHINAVFCFPPLPRQNFRYNPDLGGGALMDLGAYMVSPGRYFFGEQPVAVQAWSTEMHDTLAVGIRLAMLYEGKRSFSGYYSFNAEYQNHIKIIGENFNLEMDRFFTTPPNMETQVHIRSNNKTWAWNFPENDAFSSYLRRIIGINSEEERERERRIIIEDQQTLSMIRQSLEDEA